MKLRIFSPSFLSLLIAGFSQSACQANPVRPDVTARPLNIRPFKARPSAIQASAKPVIAVVAENEMTEITDYVIPYAVLSRSGAAEVFALATKPGEIPMYPALKIKPQATTADFDTRFPQGADYVIVPAVHNSKDPVLLAWIRRQAEKGATIVGVCDGAWVLGYAGLLRGRAATGFWYALDDLEKQFKDTTWLRNRRYLQDGNVITTTAVTASIPVSLALVEAIAGRERALQVASEMGVSDWSAEHDSKAYRLSAGHMLTVAKNTLAFWNHEKLGIEIQNGVDDVALSLLADAYSRTYRSQVFSVAAGSTPIRSKSGLEIIPDKSPSDIRNLDHMLPEIGSRPALTVFEESLSDIKTKYGENTESLVRLLLEVPSSNSKRDAF